MEQSSMCVSHFTRYCLRIFIAEVLPSWPLHCIFSHQIPTVLQCPGVRTWYTSWNHSLKVLQTTHDLVANCHMSWTMTIPYTCGCRQSNFSTMPLHMWLYTLYRMQCPYVLESQQSHVEWWSTVTCVGIQLSVAPTCLLPSGVFQLLS